MYSKEMVIPIRFNLSCFEVIVKWDGELEYVFTDDSGAHYFDSDTFVEICRAFDSVEFHELVDTHNECVKAYETYGSSYGELFVAYGASVDVFSNAVDTFESSIEHRIECLSKRSNAHTEWKLATYATLSDELITFYTLCEIGSRMLGVDYCTLAY